MSAYDHDDDSGITLDQRVDAYMDLIADKRLGAVICVFRAAADKRTCKADDRRKLKRAAAILEVAIEEAAEVLATLEHEDMR